MADASGSEVWGEVEALLEAADHRTVVVWAAECAARATGRFADDDHLDPRLDRALAHVRGWVEHGLLEEAAHRSVVVSAHNAARSLPDRTGIRAAARAVAALVATLQAPEHAVGVAMYAAMAARDAGAPAAPPDVAAAAAERVLQRDRLTVLLDGRGSETAAPGAGASYSVAPGEGVDDATWLPQTARAPESPTR